MKIQGKYILLLLAIIAIGGYLFFTFANPFDDKGKYYDDDAFIVSEGTSFSFYDKIGDDSDLRFTKFSGTYQLLTFQGDRTVEIQLDSDITKGRFKVVLIDPQNNITILENTTTEINAIEGQYRIKMVGDNASGDMQINVSFIENEGLN